MKKIITQKEVVTTFSKLGFREEILEAKTTIFGIESFEEREEIEKFLKSKHFEISDGIFGEQEDFAIGLNAAMTDPEENGYRIDIQNNNGNHDKMLFHLKENFFKIRYLIDIKNKTVPEFDKKLKEKIQILKEALREAKETLEDGKYKCHSKSIDAILKEIE